MEDNVGTRPESVVKRRGRLTRGSWATCGWGRRGPLREGDTSGFMGGVSLRGDCWERKRKSSMVGKATVLVHAGLAKGGIGLADCLHEAAARNVSDSARQTRQARPGQQSERALDGREWEVEAG